MCPCAGVCVSGGSRRLLKLSQHGSYWQAGSSWQAGKYWERYWGIFFAENNGGIWGQRWQFLTVHIENVIISVTMITKKLFVTRAPNLRCKAFLPLWV